MDQQRDGCESGWPPQCALVSRGEETAAGDSEREGYDGQLAGPDGNVAEFDGGQG